MRLPKEDPARLLTLILYVGVAVGAVFVFFKYLFSVLLPFVLGFLLSLLLRPAMRLIRFRTNVSKKIISALLVSVCGAFAVFILYLSSARLYREGRELVTMLSENMKGENPLSYFKDIPLISSLVSVAENTGVDILKTAGHFFEEKIPSLVGTLAEFLPNFIFFFAAFVFSAVYFLSDYDKIRSFCREKLSGGMFSKLGFIKRKTVSAICGFLKGYLLIMLLTFAELFLGFIILGVDYALLTASVAALVDILPILGVGTVLLPWALYEFSVGNAVRAGGLCLLFIIISGVRQFAEPAILGKKVGLHPLLSMFSMYLGYKLFSFVGMLFFPFLSSLIMEIIHSSAKES